MKKQIVLYIGAALMGLGATAQPRFVQQYTVRDTTVCGITVQNATMKRNADLMSVDLDLMLGAFDVDGNRATVFTPVIANGDQSLELAPVGVYGRRRWYQYLRDDEQPLGGAGESSYRWSERPETMVYSQVVPYAEWMNGSRLVLKRCDYGCCRTLLDEQEAPLAGYREQLFAPKSIYRRPAVEAEKLRELKGRAFIDFPVNRTELYPEYRKNPTELAKIVATIDSVRNDKDITVKRITIKGWASPESPWENNTRLAKGRTATLKEYVQNLYRFPEGFIETDYYPEDWEGLRAFVETSGLEHKNEILALIDDPTLAPDPKEAKLKKSYPAEYKFLLTTVYPGLRHSDYTIEYTIRQFSDPAEIRNVMATSPQKLSLEEFFVLAQSLEPGSEAYNEVFETAVKMYPNDETANLNAANAAIDRNDFKSAEKYLAKAGTGAEAEYTRGKLASLQGDFTTAEKHFAAAAQTLPEAEETLQLLRREAQFFLQ